VSIISGVLFDDDLNHTNEVEFFAFCAIDDRVPLILGFKGLLYSKDSRFASISVQM